LGLHFGFRGTNVFTFDFYANAIDTPVTYTDTGWHYWVGTYDAATGARKLYRDGELVAEDTASADYQGTGPLIIGRRFLSDGYFQGRIDDVSVWNRALTQEEIQTIMSTKLQGNETDLVGYWSFDLVDYWDLDGGTVYDQSGNDNDGTLHGNPTLFSSPVVNTTTSALSYTENDAPIIIDSELTITDVYGMALVGATVSITSGYTSGEDVLSFIPQLDITGSFNATTGVLTLEGSTMVENYETVLRTVVYRNTSDNPTTTQRAVEFTVNDGFFTGSATRNIDITAVDDPLRIITNEELTLSEGGEASITKAALEAADPDDQDTSQIIYTLVTPPSHGVLRLNQSSLATNGTFTQDDIDNNRVSYTHDGSEDTSSDSFTFAAVGITGQHTFNISIIPVDDPSVITVNTGITLDEGTAKTITKAFLEATDVDSESDEITYTLIAQPNEGNLSLLGVPLTGGSTFTQNDIDNNRVNYTHAGSENTISDSFTFLCARIDVNEPGLLGYWNFDNETANDLSANGNDGTLQGNPSFSDGKWEGDSALNLDGVDDYVDVGQNINIANQSFSLAAWVKRERTGVFEWVFSQGQVGDNLGLHVGFRGTNVFTFDFYNNGIDTPVTYTDTGWHYWVGTYDAGNNQRKVYRDGQIVAEDIANHYQGTGPLIIGRRFLSDGFLQGQIDEVSIWNRALTQEEIQSIGCGTFNITVNPVNDVPVAIAQNLVFEDRADVAIELKGEDEETDNASLAVSITSLPTAGSLYQTQDGQTRGAEITAVDTVTPSGKVIYVFGQGTFWDKFGFKVNDGSNDSEESLVTVAVGSPDNLLQNPYAVADVGWTYVEGFRRAYTGTTQIEPLIGNWLFYGGTGTLNESKAYQDIDVSQHAELIDSGNAEVAFTGWIKTLGNGDSGYLALDFLTGAEALSHEPYVQVDWQQHSIEESIPKGVRTIRAEMVAERGAGGRSTSVYFDYLSLEIIEKIEPVTPPPVDTTFSISVAAANGDYTDANNIAAVADDALDGEDERDARAAPSPQFKLSFLDRNKVEFDRDARPNDGRLSHHWFFTVGNPQPGVPVQIFWSPSKILRQAERQYQVIRLVEFNQDGNATNTKTLEPQSLGSGLQFDGVDDYIDVDNIDLANKSFSLAAWIKRGRTGVYDFVIAQGQDGQNLGLQFGFANNNKFMFEFYQNGITYPYTDNDWHYWVGTYDATTSERKLYVDGNLVAEDTASAHYQGTGNLIIGKRYLGPSYFQGQIGEVSVWNRAISQEEIGQSMNASLIGNENGLIGYWPLDECSGTSTPDRSPNEHHGALHGNLGAVLAHEYIPTEDETARFFRLDVMQTSFVAAELSKGPSGWNFFSVPITPENADPLVNLGDDIDSLKMYKYDTRLKGYKIYPLDSDEVSLQTGYGYFTRLENKAEVDVGGTLNDTDLTLSLDTVGWHAIGNPFLLAVNVADLQITPSGESPVLFAQAVTDGLVESTLYRWNIITPKADFLSDLPLSDGYEPVSLNSGESSYLNPWEGCWLKTHQPDLTLAIPAPANLPQNPILPDRYKPPMAPSNDELQTTNHELEKGGFALRLEVASEFASDLITTLGTNKSAKKEWDVLDSMEPPILSQTVAAYFEHNDWEKNSGQYNYDYQPALKVGEERTWKLTVYSDRTEAQMKLSWKRTIENVPSDIVLHFRRSDGQSEWHDMREVEFVDLASQSQSAETLFEIRAQRFEMSPLSDLKVTAGERKVTISWLFDDSDFISSYTIAKRIEGKDDWKEKDFQPSSLPVSQSSNPPVFRFVDRDVEEEATYTYQLTVHFLSRAKLHSDRFTVTVLPFIKNTALLQSYPNPFNPDVWIPYELANEAPVSIEIYNSAGHLVRRLDLGRQSRGRYTRKEKAAYWDGRSDSGERSASGVYFYVLKAGDFVATRKMAILK